VTGLDGARPLKLVADEGKKRSWWRCSWDLQCRRPRRSQGASPALLPCGAAASSSSDGGQELRLSGHRPISLPVLLSVDVAGAISSPSVVPGVHLFLPLLAAMARSSNGWPRGGATRGVAHVLGCALFDACGIETGHPVVDGVPPVRRQKRQKSPGARRPVLDTAPSATSLTLLVMVVECM
jgi:hypothetical protein